MPKDQISQVRSCLSLIAIACLTLISWAQASKPVEQRTTESLAVGVEHIEIKRGDFTAETTDRWQIHVLIIAPTKATIRLVRAMDEIVGTETTSSLATRHSAIAAINAGFFRVAGTYRGEPDGLLVVKGKVLSEPVRGGAAMVLTNAGESTRVSFARFAFTSTLRLNGKETISMHGFNRPRQADELIAFTPEFHRTTLTSPDGIEVIVRNRRVFAVRDGQGSQPIPTDGFVLSATGTARLALTKLRQGMKVEINSQIKAIPSLSFAPEAILGGGPILLTNGKVQTNPDGFNPLSFVNARHPRTAIGTRKDGTLVLVTVDGRQPKKSVGMTIPELAMLMLELGCEEAMNLDGGGSTTMVIRNKVVNSFSDATGERGVSDALLVLPR